MIFEIGHKVKVRIPGGGTWPGVVKSLRYTKSPSGPSIVEYGVELEMAIGDIEYYRGYDLLSDMPRGYVYGATCGCGSATLGHPGHAWYCDIEMNKRYLVGGRGNE